MLKTKSNPEKPPILVDSTTLQDMLCVGRFSADKIGEDANAVVRVGRRKLYSVAKIQRYIEQIAD